MQTKQCDANLLSSSLMAATRSGLHIPSTIAYPTRSSSATIADVDVVSRCRWRGAAAIGIYDE